MTESELVQSLDTKHIEELATSMSVRNGICTFEISNRTPSGWNVTIINCGVNFYYRDGTSDTDGPRTIMLQSGQSATFKSRKENGCVLKLFWAAKIGQPGQTQNMSDWISDVSSDECMAYRSVSIEPARSIPQTRLATDMPLVATVR